MERAGNIRVELKAGVSQSVIAVSDADFFIPRVNAQYYDIAALQ
jgi:hypothetical protein